MIKYSYAYEYWLRLTRYSAIRSELPNPSPNWSAPEYIPTTNTGELEKRPVSLSNLQNEHVKKRCQLFSYEHST